MALATPGLAGERRPLACALPSEGMEAAVTAEFYADDWRDLHGLAQQMKRNAQMPVGL